MQSHEYARMLQAKVYSVVAQHMEETSSGYGLYIDEDCNSKYASCEPVSQPLSPDQDTSGETSKVKSNRSEKREVWDAVGWQHVY